MMTLQGIFQALLLVFRESWQIVKFYLTKKSHEWKQGNERSKQKAVLRMSILDENWNISNKKKEASLIIQIQFIFRQTPSYHGL